MPLIEFAGTRNCLSYLAQGSRPVPHFRVCINGRTKMNRDSGYAFRLPICDKSDLSGLENGLWISRFVNCLEELGQTEGYLFSKNLGKASRMSDFEDEFFYPLEALQEENCPNIEPDCDIREDYGIWRSLRRGVSAHAINVGLRPHLIHIINRWRSDKDKQAQTNDILDAYADLDRLLPMLLRYSLSL